MLKKRFQAIDFEVIEIDGHNFDQIDKAFVQAKNSTMPVLIIAKTVIAKGAVTLEGSHHSHGAPLGVDEIKQAKIKAGFNPDVDFEVSADVKGAFDKLIIGSTMQNRLE